MYSYYETEATHIILVQVSMSSETEKLLLTKKIYNTEWDSIMWKNNNQW